ncbi:MAG: capsule assembly Wzi family protein [Gemmatimonadaceae bacterium]
MIRPIRVWLLLFALLLTSGELRAQASPHVPLNDAVYSQLDQIIGSGLVRTAMYGQRPYRRTEIARLISEAGEQATKKSISASTEQILKRLELRFARELAEIRSSESPSRTIREIAREGNVELLVLDSPARAIEGAPTGGIAADVNPLLNNRQGQRFAEGTTTVATSVATVSDSWSFGKHLAAQLTPRFVVGVGKSKEFTELTLQSGGIDFSAFNLNLSIGRQQRAWGQGLEGGMLLSSSSRPLDMISIETDHPFRIPHPFGWLGSLRANAFVADLGVHQNFPHAKIVAYKLSSRLNSFLELGVAMMVQQGGSGAPTANFVDHFFDFFPIRNDTRDNPPQFSNKIGGFDARVRIPMLHSAQVYVENSFDDIDPHRLQHAFWEDGGHIVGISVAQVGASGALSATAEYHHTGLRFYRHALYTSGVTFNRTLLGDPLGPEGDGANARLRFDRGGRQSWQLDAAIERRDGDVWKTEQEGARANNFHFVLVESKPEEWRRRVQVQWSWNVKTLQRLTLQGGIENVRNFVFVNNANRANSLVSARYSWGW